MERSIGDASIPETATLATHAAAAQVKLAEEKPSDDLGAMPEATLAGAKASLAVAAELAALREGLRDGSYRRPARRSPA